MATAMKFRVNGGKTRPGRRYDISRSASGMEHRRATDLRENGLSPGEREELAKACSLIPLAVARSYRNSEYDEAFSAAQAGVWRAVCLWTPEKGANLLSYATQWAAGMAITAVRKWRRRGFYGAPAGPPVLPLVPERYASLPAPPPPEPELDERLELLVGRLERGNRTMGWVARQRLRGLTFAEIAAADELGRSRQWAEQLYARAEERLKALAGRLK